MNPFIKFVKFEVLTADETKDFGRNEQNRLINHGHIEKLKKQWLESASIIPPITVNAVTKNVIDGQHRLESFQKLVESGDLPANSTIKVMWVEIPYEAEKGAIIRANTNSKNWSLDDYISSYAKAGLKNYVELDDWCKRHTLSFDKNKSKYRYGSAIITGRRCAQELKDGTFAFTKEEADNAEIIHAELSEIIDLFELNKGPFIESLAVAWHSKRSSFKFSDWLKAFKKKKSKIMKMPKESSGDWCIIFDMIAGHITTVMMAESADVDE